MRRGPLKLAETPKRFNLFFHLKEMPEKKRTPVFSTEFFTTEVQQAVPLSCPGAADSKIFKGEEWA